MLVLSVSCLHLSEVGSLFFVWRVEDLMLGELAGSQKGLSTEEGCSGLQGSGSCYFGNLALWEELQVDFFCASVV